MESKPTTDTTTPDGLGKCNIMQMPSMKHLAGRKPLDFLNGKMYKQSFDSRKNRSGHKPEHEAAIAEDAERVVYTETDGNPLPKE